MKKYCALLLALAFISTSYGHRNAQSRSFMFTKPGYYNIVAEQALWHGIVYNKKGTLRGGLQIIPFYQQSTGLNKTARYFLFEHLTQLRIAGDNTLPVNTRNMPLRDVRAEWLGLPSNFSGTLSINPKQQQAGFVLEYSHDLKKWFTTRFVRDMYISFILPVVSVTNNMHLTQNNIINEGTTFPQNIIQAFNQPEWCYGKIFPEKKHQTNAAELKILLGTSYESTEYLQVNYNSILVIPIAKKNKTQSFYFLLLWAIITIWELVQLLIFKLLLTETLQILLCVSF